MQKQESCYVIDGTGNKVMLCINTAALTDIVEAFKDLSLEHKHLVHEQEVNLQAARKVA